MSSDSTMRGIAHGKTIELDQDLGLPEGQPVTVVVRACNAKLSSEAGLERAFGGWSDESDDLDDYLAWSRQQRKTSRTELDP